MYTPDPNKSSLENVNGALQHVAGQLENVKEIQARLQSLEQVVVGAETRGRAFSASGGRRISASVLEQLGDSSNFQAAAEVAARGGKLPRFDARVNVDASIRAALVGGGSGSSDGNTMPSDPERGGIVRNVAAPLRLLDVLPSRPTTSDAVEFVQVTATGDASEQVAQGDTKAQLEFEGTLSRAEISTVAGWTSASRQVLSDNAALQAQIDVVIRSKIVARLEQQLLNGTGGSGKILGLIAQAAAFTPTVTTTAADVIGEALVTMLDAGYAPTVVVMNPLDWLTLQITKTLTEGAYLFGSPTMPIPPALWNTRVVTPASMPASQFLTVDASFATVLDREQLSVTVSNSHADYFVRNLVAILGELRAGLEVLDVNAVRIGSLPVSSS